MKPKGLVTVCMLFFLAVGSKALCQTFPLEYRLLPAENMAWGSSGWFEGTAEEAEGIGPQPEYHGRPVYVLFPFGADGEKKPFLLVFGKSKAGQGEYDLLYVDSDRDGDIREEKAVSIGEEAEFEVSLLAGGKPVVYRFKINVFPGEEAELGIPSNEETGGGETQAPSLAGVLITSRGAWMGKFNLNGEAIDVALMDGNVNGIYNEPGDGFMSKLPRGFSLDYSAIHSCPALFEAGGRIYDVTLAPDGTSISFEPAKGPFGTIETEVEDLTLLLATGNGGRLTAKASNRRILVPAGRVNVFIYVAKKIDKDGSEWIAVGRIMGDPSGELNIEEGTATRIKAGPPLNLVVTSDMEKRLKPGSTVKFTPRILDSAGITVQVLPVSRKNPELPDTYIIIKQGDKVLTRGKCEHG